MALSKAWRAKQPEQQEEETFTEVGQVKNAVNQPPINPRQQVPPPLPSVKWLVDEVATQTQPFIVNANTGERLDLYSAIALILNAVDPQN